MGRGVTGPEGVAFYPLEVIADERGAVLHVLKEGDPGFGEVREIYCSEINPGVIKGWKRHRAMTQRLVVPHGRVRFVVHDERHDSATRGETAEFVLGRPDGYGLLVVPPGVLYAFQGLGTEPALIVNSADLPHRPDECETLPLDHADTPAIEWAAPQSLRRLGR